MGCRTAANFLIAVNIIGGEILLRGTVKVKGGINKKVTLTSLYVIVTAVLFIFMFRNGDQYFNINEYRNGLFLTVLLGITQILSRITKINGKSDGKIIIFVIGCIGYMAISKYILGLPAEPYYILFISILYLFLLFMAVINFNTKQLQFLIKSYILSATIMSLLILIQHKTPYSVYGIFRLALFYGTEEYYDVNFTAMYVIIPTLFSFKMALKSKRQSRRILYLLCVIINVIAILMLGSRGAFAPILAIIVFENLKDKQVSMVKILIPVVGIFVICFLLPQDVITRLLGGNYINMESKRIIDWKFGIDAFKMSPWFGNGMVSPKKIVTQVSGVDWYTIHNTYIVYLAQLGVIGSIPFFLILIYPLKKLWNGIKQSFLFLSYCALLFAALMIESNYSYVLIVPLSVFYALIHYSIKNGTKEVLESVLNLKN